MLVHSQALLLLLLCLLSASGYRYDFPTNATPPLLAIDLFASFTLNSSTLHVQANSTFQVSHSPNNISISFLLEESSNSKFTFLFTNAVTWQLTSATFSRLLNGSENTEKRDQLLLQLGDSLPIPIQRNHSYLCYVPFSHSSSSYLSKVEIHSIQFEVSPATTEFSEAQVCLIAYNEFWAPTIFGISQIIFLIIVVIINGLYHSVRKHGRNILSKKLYTLVPNSKKRETERASE